MDAERDVEMDAEMNAKMDAKMDEESCPHWNLVIPCQILTFPEVVSATSGCGLPRTMHFCMKSLCVGRGG